MRLFFWRMPAYWLFTQVQVAVATILQGNRMKLGGFIHPGSQSVLADSRFWEENNCPGVLEDLVSNHELVLSHVLFLWPSSLKWD